MMRELGAHWRRRLVHVLMQYRRHRFATKRTLVGEHLVEHDAQRCISPNARSPARRGIALGSYMRVRQLACPQWCVPYPGQTVVRCQNARFPKRSHRQAWRRVAALLRFRRFGGIRNWSHCPSCDGQLPRPLQNPDLIRPQRSARRQRVDCSNNLELRVRYAGRAQLAQSLLGYSACALDRLTSNSSLQPTR
jgi:hypothetical protein